MEERDKSDDAAPARTPGAAVCAVVVTYRPAAEVLANLAALRAQVAGLVVVDNAASAASRARLAPLAADPAVELIFNADNRGVAAALNQGAERAEAGGYAWLATFDQDSRVPAGFVGTLLASGAAWPERERVAVLAPIYRDASLGFLYSASAELDEAVRADRLVSVSATSGNLVRLKAWRAVGGFREDLFIDGVDFEFALRCRRRGWLVLETPQAVLEHAQGCYEHRRFFRRQARINDYPPGRRYYQARNRAAIFFRYLTFDPRWVLRDARGFVADTIKLGLYSERRGAKLRAMLTGFCHAARGRLGRWDGGGD